MKKSREYTNECIHFENCKKEWDCITGERCKSFYKKRVSEKRKYLRPVCQKENPLRKIFTEVYEELYSDWKLQIIAQKIELYNSAGKLLYGGFTETYYSRKFA